MTAEVRPRNLIFKSWNWFQRKSEPTAMGKNGKSDRERSKQQRGTSPHINRKRAGISSDFDLVANGKKKTN